MRTALIIELVLLLLNLIVIVGIFIVTRLTWPYLPHFTSNTKSKKKVLVLKDTVLQDRWRRVTARARTETPETAKLALIEADTFVDDVLKRLNLTGKTMAERLEELNEDEFKSLEAVWRAHRLRNTVVHSPDIEVSKEQIERALKAYESFLQEAGVLTK